jgi:hypothetical protein
MSFFFVFSEEPLTTLSTFPSSKRTKIYVPFPSLFAFLLSRFVFLGAMSTGAPPQPAVRSCIT